MSDLKFSNKPLFMEWEFERPQLMDQRAGQTKGQTPRNQAKKKTAAANAVGYERAIPPGVRGSSWW